MKDITCQACFQDWSFTESEWVELCALFDATEDEEIAELDGCPKCIEGPGLLAGHA
jgi:hypothetical protein